jgi:hypothetical protein
MIRNLLMVLVVTVLLHSEVGAADKTGNYQVLGSGALSCGSWTAERKKGSDIAAAKKILVTGYISAYNRWVHPGYDVTEGTDNDGVYAWIDYYCQAHPLDMMAIAVEALIEHFRSR